MFLRLILLDSWEFPPKIRCYKIHYHYLGHKVQNGFISILAHGVKSSIMKIIEEAKYFFYNSYCTPNVSHQEQMIEIVPCINKSNNKIKIKEYFLEYLKFLDLNINYVRGRGYDNGSNMKGNC
ncbi:hypothetical protein CR513_37933, partial [Mucuna pruriens]